MPTGKLDASAGGQNRLSTAEQLRREALHEFLGIAADEEVTSARLLGLREDERNVTVIERAADRQLQYVRGCATNRKYGPILQQLLNEISAAKDSLSNAPPVLEKHVTEKPVPAPVTAAPAQLQVAKPLPQAHPKPLPQAAILTPEVVTQPIVIQRHAGQHAAHDTKQPTFLQQRWKELAAGGIVLGSGLLALLIALWISNSGKPATTAERAHTGSEATAPQPTGKKDRSKPTTQIPASTGPDFQFKPIQEDTNPAPANTSPPMTEVSSINQPVRSFLPPGVVPADQPPVDQPTTGNSLVPQGPGPLPAANVPTLSKEQVDAKRTTLLERIGLEKTAKPTVKQYEQIREFANDPTVKTDPVAHKATIIVLFTAATQLDDGEKMLDALGHIRGQAALFNKQESLVCAKMTMQTLAKSGKHNGALNLLQEIEAADEMPREEVPGLQASILRAAVTVKEVRTNEVERGQVARKMLDVARAMAKVDPAAARILITDALKAFGTVQDPVLRKAFVDQSKETRADVDAAQRFHDATAALKSDPSNESAQNIVAEYEFASGDVRKGLTLLAALPASYPLSSLAKETNEVLAPAAASNGNRCLECAEDWLKIATSGTSARKLAAQRVAATLLQQAVDSKEIDVISLASAKKLLADLGPIDSLRSPQIAEAPQPLQPRTIDALEGLDLAKHVVDGEWSRTDKGDLVVKTIESSHLVLPGWQAPAGSDFEIQLDFEVERLQGREGIHIIVPVGPRTSVTLGGWPDTGYYSGIGNLDGQKPNNNSSSVKGNVLPAGKHHVTAQVAQRGATASIVIFVDSKEWIRWSGDLQRLTSSSSKGLALEPGRFYLGSYKSEFAFRSIVFHANASSAGPSSASQLPVGSSPPLAVQEDLTQEPTRPNYVPKEAVWNAEFGSWYQMLDKSMNFNEAIKVAAAQSATPVIVDSLEENNFVYRLLPKQQDIWLGLVKGADGKLYRLDGQLAAFENWNPGEGTFKGEKHVFMMWGGKHADSYPDNKQARVCLEWKYQPRTAPRKN
ncbi:hypothetical protein ETAA8_66120 [Anatilimnocola aggregata]|uniref:C-type lectin domain-containing protein n=1 Tax=Anatilimnocola aggregata TaxID=2528021 RepID=A0A517YML1_9BACT|nr:C-type lectin domain-containing protein [Anatilimnocola aggregata]QDU31454.1 hypothetical protein ETAA8_66120 [Anatilimnocola aggregata]